MGARAFRNFFSINLLFPTLKFKNFGLIIRPRGLPGIFAAGRNYAVNAKFEIFMRAANGRIRKTATKVAGGVSAIALS